MLTEILIKPFIEDLERQGIEDTTPYEQGFMAGMAALSSILSEHVDNKAQLFVYLGMSVSEGMQWVYGQAMERDNIAPIFAEQPQEPRERQPTPSNDFATEDKNEDWDYIPTHDDLPASIIQKYSRKKVWFKHDLFEIDKICEGRTILDLSTSRLQVIDMNGNQIKRPYYIKLR